MNILCIKNCINFSLITVGVGGAWLIWNVVASAQLPLTKTVATSDLNFGKRPDDTSFRQPTLIQAAAIVSTPAISSPKQITQNPPSSVPPGTIEPPRPSLPPLPDRVPTPAPTPPLDAPQPVPPQSPSAPEVRVKVDRVEVLGSTVFSQAELDKVVAPFIGKEATFEDLLAIRAAITDLYTSSGYTTSGAFLPSQDLTSGVVQIQVVEGALERIEIQGLRRLRTGYVRSRISNAAKAPINLRRLEEGLQLLQLNPLIAGVQAELTAGSAPGLSVLTLNLREAPPLSSVLLVENRDSPSIGEVRGTAVLTHQNLLGLGDRLSADVGFTEGLETYNASYDIPLNSREGTLSLRYYRNSSRIVEEPFTPLDIVGRAETYSIGFRQPLVRTPQSEFALSLAADLRRSRTFLEEDIPFSFSEGPEDGRSRVTVLRFGQEWVNRRRNQVLAARSQFSLGLNALGATVNENAPDGQFFNWVGQVQFVQAFAPDTILIARAATQLSTDSLLPIEQFTIGGFDTVRGYRQNQQVGDNGAIASIEFRYPIVRDADGIGIIQLAPFFDIGTIWNQDGPNPSPRTLIGTGLGLRWQIRNFLFARLDWGIPLNSVATDGDSLQDEGIYFSIQLQPF